MLWVGLVVSQKTCSTIGEGGKLLQCWDDVRCVVRLSYLLGRCHGWGLMGREGRVEVGVVVRSEKRGRQGRGFPEAKGSIMLLLNKRLRA